MAGARTTGEGASSAASPELDAQRARQLVHHAAAVGRLKGCAVAAAFESAPHMPYLATVGAMCRILLQPNHDCMQIPAVERRRAGPYAAVGTRYDELDTTRARTKPNGAG